MQEELTFTHTQFSDGSIMTWRQYAIPERTWLVLHDAVKYGSWSEIWLSRMGQNRLHPDVPTIPEINAQLMETGISQATLRDLVYLVAALTVEVENEAKHMTRIEDIVIEQYEPFRPYYSELVIDDEEDDDDEPIRFTVPIVRTIPANNHKGQLIEILLLGAVLVMLLLDLLMQH